MKSGPYNHIHFLGDLRKIYMCVCIYIDEPSMRYHKINCDINGVPSAHCIHMRWFLLGSTLVCRRWSATLEKMHAVLWQLPDLSHNLGSWYHLIGHYCKWIQSNSSSMENPILTSNSSSYALGEDYMENLLSLSFRVDRLLILLAFYLRLCKLRGELPVAWYWLRTTRKSLLLGWYKIISLYVSLLVFECYS